LDVLVWRAASGFMNPSIRGDRLAEEARTMDPSRYAREFGAEFVDDLAVAPRRADGQAVDSGMVERQYVSGVTYTRAIDASGGGGTAKPFYLKAVQDAKSEHWASCEKSRERRQGFQDIDADDAPLPEQLEWTMPRDPDFKVPGWSFEPGIDAERVVWLHKVCGKTRNNLRTTLEAFVARQMQEHQDRGADHRQPFRRRPAEWNTPGGVL